MVVRRKKWFRLHGCASNVSRFSKSVYSKIRKEKEVKQHNKVKRLEIRKAAAEKSRKENNQKSCDYKTPGSMKK